MKTRGKSVAVDKKVVKEDSPDSDSSVYSDLSDESMEESNVVVKKKTKGKSENKNIISDGASDSDSSVYSDLSDESIDERETVKTKTKKKSMSKKTVKKDAPDSDSRITSDLSDDESMTEFDINKTDLNLEPVNDNETTSTISKSSQNNEVDNPKQDEYEFDTSDEEDIRNTVGNIPMKWYDDFPHIGYDVAGKKIIKPATTDEIDEFLSKMDDPNYWRTVKNKMTGEKVVLTDEDIEIIQRLQSGRYPSGDVKYEPFEDFFTYEKMKHPVTHFPPHKRSFVPSKIEKEKVSKLVHAIKMGWIKPRVPREEKDAFYMMWDKDVAEDSKRLKQYIPAPKRKLPGHEESYNPPPEYLFTNEEEEQWKEQEPEDRKLDFIPRKYSTLRQVPAYSIFTREAFERCLDLYLCPRQRKMRVNVDPNDLLPPLPKPKDLQPFPTTLAIVYNGHSELVRCITVEPSGQFLASGCDDHTVKIWEILTGRCLRTINVGGVVKSLAWCPSEALALLCVAVDEKVFVINAKVGDKVVLSNTDSVLSSIPQNAEDSAVIWNLPTEEQRALGFRLIINHNYHVKQVVWHAKGDYFATLTSEDSFRAIIIHQLSKCRSQVPFRKLSSKIQCIMFHPLRPFFFVASQKHVKMFNLLKQEISKKLIGNSKLISSMAIHPQGDNIIVGSYDCRVNWFDLELSTKPYKTFRQHQKAVRQVVYHKRYPLFASTSDDGNVIISHGMVYSDLLQNPTIHFVKALKGHEMSMDCIFHPQRPWIFSTSGNTIRLYS